jgi:hypothetical protein
MRRASLFSSLFRVFSVFSSLLLVGEDQENGLPRRRGDAENTLAMLRIWEAVLESGISRCVNGLKEENLSRREDDESP